MKRRNFIKYTSIASAGLMGLDAKAYNRIIGANDRVQVGVVGFSDRFKESLFPTFQNHAKELNFEFVALSDIWNLRRDKGKSFLEEKTGNKIKVHSNNESLYSANEIDAVIISTADFQHAYHLLEAIKANKDAYVEKPFAETMDDANAVLKAASNSNIVIQVGSQRRSGTNYHQANEYIRSGKFGAITTVELTWNVNQPGRWRRPQLVSNLKESDVDWKRFLCNRPKDKFDPRKFVEYRLFWPYSSGIPGQWMCHQIDTVHWFTGLDYPRSVVANGGIYMWKDGRTNADTLGVVMDYGPKDNMKDGFQVLFNSRFHNSSGGTKEVYFSNGGEINLDNNSISPNGGLEEGHAKVSGMRANLLPTIKLEETKVASGESTGGDNLTSAHMRNWMECVRSRAKTNAPVEAGYNHSVAGIMTNAAFRTGHRATFDDKKKEVMAGGKVFKY
jgi:predicted dehydrogenase